MMLIAFVIVSSMTIVVECQAQCDADQTFSTERYRQGTVGDTLDLADSIFFVQPSALYRIVMPYDSCQVQYVTGAFRKNGSPIYLLNWCKNATHNSWDNQQMRDSSGTQSFAVATGDTVKFYRDFGWGHSTTALQTLTNYYSDDTLSFAVELIRVSDGYRLALLDSIGAMRKVPAGTPTLHGTHPIIANISYAVPSTMNGTIVKIRISAYARGNGPHYFVRNDDFGFNFGLETLDSNEAWYISNFGGGIAKRNVKELESHLRAETGASISVSPDPTKGLVQIECLLPSDSKNASLSIYNSRGEREFILLASAMPQEKISTSYIFKAVGTYYVALFEGNRLVKTHRITVRK
jgi:hypothetical protein